MKYFYRVNDMGMVLSGCSEQDIVPEGHFEISEAEYLQYQSAPHNWYMTENGIEFAPDVPAVLGIKRIYKAPMFRRMTDAEYEVYKQIRAGFSERLAAIFDAAEYLSPDDEYWPDLFAAAVAAYGPARAAEILEQAL